MKASTQKQEDKKMSNYFWLTMGDQDPPWFEDWRITHIEPELPVDEEFREYDPLWDTDYWNNEELF
jgi:hypothetical protein